MTLPDLYRLRLSTPSDISEHMPRLLDLASKCKHVTEFGVRSGNSTIAFLSGLGPDGVLVSYDRNQPNIPELDHDARWYPHEADTGRMQAIARTDMLFIDTLHTCAQVEAELRHAAQVEHWLVFHDTVLFGSCDEGQPGPGIVHPIFEFLAANPWWKVAAHYANNNGLLILERGDK